MVSTNYFILNLYKLENAEKIREDFFNKLSAYKKVNSGGKFLNNIGTSEGVVDKLGFQKKHKFAIAFENSRHKGYLTEKIISCFAAGTVPIYWGDPCINEVISSNAYINVNDFKSLDQAIDYIQMIDQDMELYKNILKQPAFKDNEYIKKKEEEIENFLINIIDQPIKYAYRRNIGGWTERTAKQYECEKNKKGQKRFCRRWPM